MPVGDFLEFRHVPPGHYAQRFLAAADDVAFVCAGTAITTAFQARSGSCGAGGRRVRLVYGSRTTASILNKGDLDALAAAHGDKLVVTHVLSREPADSGWRGERGVDRGVLKRHLPPPRGSVIVYVCGPAGLCDALCGGGGDGPPPPRRRSCARPRARGDGVALLSLFGWTLGGVFVVDWRESPVGPYREVAVLSGLVARGGAVGAWASHVVVTTPEAPPAAEIYGLPTVLGSIAFAASDGRDADAWRRELRAFAATSRAVGEAAAAALKAALGAAGRGGVEPAARAAEPAGRGFAFEADGNVAVAGWDGWRGAPPPGDGARASLPSSDDDDYVLVGDDDYKPAIEVELKKRAERRGGGSGRRRSGAACGAAAPPPPSGPRFLVINRSGAIGAAPVRRQFAKKRDEVVRKQKKAVSRLAGGGGSPLVTRHFARPSPILENTRYPATSSSARYGTETKDEFGWPKAAGSPWRF
ncbi:hypothetical protein JL720_132 [Aureococcus anophagefferens]|nr:hypothetical protein JL720_132 [Aureococcus anophagefferens]